MKKLITLLLALALSMGLMMSTYAEKKLYLSNAQLEVGEPDTDDDELDMPQESTGEEDLTNVNQNPGTGR